MPDETRHESEDLEDYQVQDSTDTLNGAPGDDPLDRGVVPPERWSAGIRYGVTATEQEEGESLDQLLAEEEPDDARSSPKTSSRMTTRTPRTPRTSRRRGGRGRRRRG